MKYQYAPAGVFYSKKERLMFEKLTQALENLRSGPGISRRNGSIPFRQLLPPDEHYYHPLMENSHPDALHCKKIARKMTGYLEKAGLDTEGLEAAAIRGFNSRRSYYSAVKFTENGTEKLGTVVVDQMGTLRGLMFKGPNRFNTEAGREDVWFLQIFECPGTLIPGGKSHIYPEDEYTSFPPFRSRKTGEIYSEISGDLEWARAASEAAFAAYRKSRLPVSLPENGRRAFPEVFPHIVRTRNGFIPAVYYFDRLASAAFDENGRMQGVFFYGPNLRDPDRKQEEPWMLRLVSPSGQVIKKGEVEVLENAQLRRARATE